MQYLTYEEYTEIGGTLDLTAFMRNINRACSFIDWCTQNRLRAILAPSDTVKACVRDVCELYALNSAGEEQVTRRSQSGGGGGDGPGGPDAAGHGLPGFRVGAYR